MKGHSARVVVVLTILSMVLSLLPAITLAAPPNGSKPTPEVPPKVETSASANLDKISPDLRDAAIAASDKQVRVIVFALPNTDFHGLLQHPLTGKIKLGDLHMTTGLATDATLLKLAGLQGVQAIMSTGGAAIPPPPNEGDGPPAATKGSPAARPAAAAPTKASSGQTPQPNTWNGHVIVGAAQANAAGFTGNGVIVSVNDTGVDFGHPDLQGTEALDPNPASPYYGWPMVADDDSIYNYLSFGSTYGTYYADTSSTFSYPTGSGTGSMAIYNGVLTHTITFSNTSKSGVYHYGWHPDYSLGYTEGASNTPVAPMVLLVDEHTAGVYDTVYVDLGDGDVLTYDFTTARPARKGSPEVWKDLTGDGVADVSGGMVYWIADGVNWMPGTEVLYIIPPDWIPPDNGSLVAFFGDFNGQSHGTGVASQVVAQGVITSQFGGVNLQTGQSVNVPNLPGVVSDTQVIGGVVRGTAPGATLFPGISGDYNNWILAAVGYDGTPLTEDDAQIITNSWGWLDIEIGWDVFGRLVTYMERYINPYTTILSASGNGGFGSGVMDANGASSSILTVGATNQFGTDDMWSIISDTSQITFDDVNYFSNRGPSGLGQVKPQVTCIGNSGSGALPLNLAVSPFTLFYDGETAWDEFGGTSQATPMCAGVLADVMQAYKMRTGIWPNYQQATNLLMSGADNINYDVLSQGAGRANADRSTRIAAGIEGAYVSPAQWTAGDYRGLTYEAFSSIMFPGSSSSKTFSVSNWSVTSPITINVASDYLVKTSQVTTTFTTVDQSQEDAFKLGKSDYLWRIDPMIPAGTDLMEVSVYDSYGEFSLGDPTDPTSQKSRGDNSWYSYVYDWKDWNNNGVLWTDTNANGVVNSGELDEPGTNVLTGAPNPDTSLEINPMADGDNSANTLQLFVQKPLERMHDGLWLGLGHRLHSTLVPVSHLQIVYTFYKHESWPWLTTSPSTLVVPPASTATFTGTMTLPADTKLGVYEGAIMLHDVSGAQELVTTVPVVVNVAANSPTFTYSSPNGSDLILDNGRVFGGYDWRGNGWYAQGDWRLFFSDVPDTTPIAPGSQFLIQTSWVVTPTDIDVFAYGPTPHDFYPPMDNSIVGPYDLAQTGGSVQTLHSTGSGFAYTFNTSTGGPMELVTGKLQTGLNEFLFHNVLYDGPPTGEPYTVTVGTATVAPASIAVTATSPSMVIPMSYSGSLDLPDGLEGMAFGLSAPMVYDNQFVATDADNYYTFTVNASGLLDLTTAPTGPTTSYDVDLFLEKYTGSSWTEIGSSEGPDANESIQVTMPADGLYRARVYGWNVPSASNKYMLTIDRQQGTDVVVSGLPSTLVSAGSTVSFTLELKNITWTGTREGILYIGPAGSPTAFPIPITVVNETMRLSLPTIFMNIGETP